MYVAIKTYNFKHGSLIHTLACHIAWQNFEYNVIGVGQVLIIYTEFAKAETQTLILYFILD